VAVPQFVCFSGNTWSSWQTFLDCGILVEVLKPVTHRRFFVCHANRCSLCVVSRCDAHIIVTWKRYYLLLRLASRRSNFSLHHCYKAYQLYYYYNILLLKRFFLLNQHRRTCLCLSRSSWAWLERWFWYKLATLQFESLSNHSSGLSLRFSTTNLLTIRMKCLIKNWTSQFEPCTIKLNYQFRPILFFYFMLLIMWYYQNFN